MMDWGQLTLVIPAFNEAGHIEIVLKQIRQSLPEVFILGQTLA